MVSQASRHMIIESGVYPGVSGRLPCWRRLLGVPVGVPIWGRGGGVSSLQEHSMAVAWPELSILPKEVPSGMD